MVVEGVVLGLGWVRCDWSVDWLTWELVVGGRLEVLGWRLAVGKELAAGRSAWCGSLVETSVAVGVACMCDRCGLVCASARL